MISVSDLVFDYPTKRALFGVSFEVRPGSITALVGPNGAGKTTLLRCIAALETPYSGSVTVGGLDVVTHPREIHAKLGYLPDFFGLYEELTVKQGLFYAARARDLPPSAAESAVLETAKLVDLSDRLDEKAEELSRGLRQRLAIGQAIVHRPEVILLDEPASGLDPEARRSLSNLMRQLQSEGMTLVVSSHILAELEDYCTEMLVMGEGRMVGSSSVDAAAIAGTGIRIRIKLAKADERLPAFLDGLDKVSVVEASDSEAVVILDGDEEAQAALLRQLSDAGFVVSSLAAEKVKLEDAYFDQIKDGQKGEPR